VSLRKREYGMKEEIYTKGRKIGKRREEKGKEKDRKRKSETCFK